MEDVWRSGIEGRKWDKMVQNRSRISPLPVRVGVTCRHPTTKAKPLVGSDDIIPARDHPPPPPRLSHTAHFPTRRSRLDPLPLSLSRSLRSYYTVPYHRAQHAPSPNHELDHRYWQHRHYHDQHHWDWDRQETRPLRKVPSKEAVSWKHQSRFTGRLTPLRHPARKWVLTCAI